MTPEILQDYSSTGEKRPWREHKMNNELLAAAYAEINPDKQRRLLSCSNRLSFERRDDGSLKLASSWFCRVRLCPMCTWRRSLKVAAQMTEIMDAIKADRPCAYIMATFTIRNCTPMFLDQEITNIIKAFDRMTRVKAYKDAVLGHYRAIEITHKVSLNEYHPHIHAILAVNPSYFTSRNYLNHERWIQMWQRAMKINYRPDVHVQRVKGDTAKAVAEVAKYSVKSNHYIIPDDWRLTVNTVRLLDTVLANRRFIAYGGIIAEWHRKLHLDDVEDGDLVHLTKDEPPPDPGNPVIHFAWYSGYRQYYAEGR